jgi:membrane-bound lytic murein transglycosylase D
MEAASASRQLPSEVDGQVADQGSIATAETGGRPDNIPTPQPNVASGDCQVLDDDDEDETQLETDQGPEEVLNQALNLCRLSQTYWQRGDLEKAIQTLDDAYSLILEVEIENDAKLLQEKEDLRFSISKRILEIYSSRHVVVNGSRNEIPITINQHVQDEIDSFTVGRDRDFFLESYRRSGRYRSKIEAALKESGLPAELSWLPLIESGFKVRALSPARALGLWQFIPSTGYRYGLNRDKYIDERLDPEKSTRAAIEYLNELHGMFGDWTTVLAAYNCGEHRVLRTIQSQNINYLDNFWDLYERLPRETARYVPRFLATLEIVKSPEKYGLSEAVVDTALEHESVTVTRQVYLKGIAQASGIEEDVLRELNAELRQGTLPADGYDLRVPIGTADIVLSKLDEIPVYKTRPAVSVASHRVRRGETLDGIAQKYGSNTKSIMLANNIRRPTHLRAGRVIRVPLTECLPQPSRASGVVQASGTNRDSVEHVVRRGDSLWNIAKRYGTTTEEIQRLNKMISSKLAVGQILKISASDPEEKRETTNARQTIYSVRSGDTLYGIAQQHNMTLDRLIALNNLSLRSKIQPGQKIIVE